MTSISKRKKPLRVKIKDQKLQSSRRVMTKGRSLWDRLRLAYHVFVFGDRLLYDGVLMIEIDTDKLEFRLLPTQLDEILRTITLHTLSPDGSIKKEPLHL